MQLDKRTGIMIAALLLLAGYSVWTNLLSGPETPVSRTAPADAPVPAAPAIPTPSQTVRAPSRNRAIEEWHPRVLPKRIEDRPDPTKVDPTLHLELFAKVQEVPPAGGSRNLFQFATAPPKEVAQLKGPEPVVPMHVWQGPKEPPPPPPPAPPPPPPPIPLKFYGYSTTLANGRKTAYFMDGEEILLAAEGDTVKRRYKIVRIGPTSAVIEDLDAKRQQSVPLTEEGQG
jgi:hypothetical protein